MMNIVKKIFPYLFFGTMVNLLFIAMLWIEGNDLKLQATYVLLILIPVSSLISRFFLTAFENYEEREEVLQEIIRKHLKEKKEEDTND